jgi:hypothetical protein
MLPGMLPRSVIPATAAAVFILSAPAQAAGAAGPSPTPLILEFALAFAVMTALALKGPASRVFAAAKRRLTPASRRQAASARARGV